MLVPALGPPFRGLVESPTLECPSYWGKPSPSYWGKPTYDSKNHLIKAGEKTYQRDAQGRAVSSTEGGTKTDYLFDGQQVIQEKKSGTSAATTSYARGLGGRLVSRRAGSGAPSYYHHDAIGSVVGLSDNTGALTDTYAYDAFGNGRARTGNSDQLYGYVGNAYEPSTKLYDFHARHYDPKAGRFASKDPVRGFKTKPQTLNPYSYGVNGPLRHPDPSGRVPFDFFLGEEAACASYDPASEQPPPEYCPSDPAQGGTEPVNGVEDFTQNDEAPEAPEDMGGEGDSYLNEGDQAEPSDASGGGDFGDGGSDGGDEGGKYDDILRPGGSPLCDPADQPDNRACPGGTEEAQNLTDDLVARGNGEEYQTLDDEGVVYKNPGDGYVTYRPTSESGEPTVEPNLTGYEDIRKIKFVGY